MREPEENRMPIYRFNKLLSTIAVVIAASTWTPTADASQWRNLVRNGSFEHGLQHWTWLPGSQIGPGFGVFSYAEGPRSNYSPPDDNFRYRLPIDEANGPLGNPGFDLVGDYALNAMLYNGLRQDLALEPGHYRAGLDILIDGPFEGALSVYLGSGALFSEIASFPGWTHHFVEFDVTTSGSATLYLVFRGNGDTEYLAVDRVYVAVNEVPEPSITALFLAGVALVGSTAARGCQRRRCRPRSGRLPPSRAPR